LVGGTVVVAVLVLSGFLVAAVLTAAVLVPVLYLVYLYEAQVYRDEPVKVIAFTLVAGVALGVAVTLAADRLINDPTTLLVTPPTGTLLVGAVLYPLVQELIKPLPVLLLRRRPAFDETIDGLAFGVAAGLGFSAAETILHYGQVIAGEPLHAAAASWLAPVLGVAVASPLMQATATGLVAASFWRGPAKRRSLLFPAALLVAVAAHVAFALGTRLLTIHGAGSIAALAWQAAVVGALLVYTRFVLHRALLDEAVDLGLAEVVCPHCRRRVAAGAFCPHCGAAVRAAPRTGPGTTLLSKRPDP
jgi:RsiW-degrading membrane proteinase PrsW (M82 family)